MSRHVDAQIGFGSVPIMSRPVPDVSAFKPVTRHVAARRVAAAATSPEDYAELCDMLGLDPAEVTRG